MKSTQNVMKIAGCFLLGISIIMGFILTSVMVWGDLEASLFTSGVRADKSLSTLKCPVVITSSETGKISVELKNPTQKPLERYLIVNISEGYASLVREIRTSLSIPPEQKQKVEWKIFPEDAAFDENVILFRVYINPRNPHPSLGANCGVVRVNIEGVTGKQIFASASIFSLTSLGVGVAMIEFGSHTKGKSRSSIKNAYALAGAVIVAGITSYFGMWVLGIALLAVALLTFVILVTRKFNA